MQLLGAIVVKIQLMPSGKTEEGIGWGKFESSKKATGAKGLYNLATDLVYFRSMLVSVYAHIRSLLISVLSSVLFYTH